MAEGYFTKLLANEAVMSYIGRHEPEILTHLKLVANTGSMEEALQQQLDSEVTEPMCGTGTGDVPAVDSAQN